MFHADLCSPEEEEEEPCVETVCEENEKEEEEEEPCVETVCEENEKEEEEEEPCVETVCDICKEVGHWPLCCPLKFNYPFGPLPRDLPDHLWVQCQRCGNGEFNERYYCTECGGGRKNVLLKRCWMCYRIGHVDNSHPNCLLVGQEFNFKTDPRGSFYLGNKNV